MLSWMTVFGKVSGRCWNAELLEQWGLGLMDPFPHVALQTDGVATECTMFFLSFTCNICVCLSLPSTWSALLAFSSCIFPPCTFQLLKVAFPCSYFLMTHSEALRTENFLFRGELLLYSGPLLPSAVQHRQAGKQLSD